MGINGSLGTVLQGVSQQQPRVRLPGQVTAQSNMHSDVVRGLVTRPPALEVASLGTDATPLEFDDIEIDGVIYIVGFRSGELRVWNLSGTEFTVNVQDVAAQSYRGDNMGFHVYDDTIYVTNRDIVVAADSTIDTDDVMLGQGIIQILGGGFGQDFTISINYDDATSATASHNVPDTDPDEINGGFILTKLTTAGSFPLSATKKATTTLTQEDNVLLITDTDFEFTITVSDGRDDTIMRQHVKLAKDLETLAKWAPHGTLVKVEGEDKADDDFYMRFEVEDETVIGDGFGKQGLWREWVNSEEAVSLDFETMPHVLFLAGGDFFFERNLWQSRRAGDEESNPHPSILGNKITDVGGFQSRLMFTAGPNVVGSRTNQPSDFYSKSVVNGVDSDPIDFSSTTESEVALRFMVPFDRDLLVMSNKHQFIVSGLTGLTPDNASMVQTTDFEMAGRARPSSTGRTILFPYTIGDNGGVKEFFASDEIATNGADDLTKTVTTYITGEIVQIATSTNFETVLIRSDDSGSGTIVWVYKYLWDDNGFKKVQSSWSKWEFPHTVAGMFWDGSRIYFILLDGTEYILTSVDMDFSNHAVGYLPTLDRQTDEVVNGSSVVSLDYDDAEFVQHTGCSNPGSRATELTKTGAGPFVYTFDTTTVPAAATVIAGIAYVSSVNPTMPFRHARDGKAKRLDAIVVTQFIVSFDNSGFIVSTRESKYRTVDQVFDNDKFITVDDPDDPNQIGIRDGSFIIPWGERSDRSTLKLEGNDIRPFTILEIDYRGQSFTRGVRVS